MFISDMGMCGAFESILGDDKDMVIARFRSGMFEPLKCASTNTFMLNGVVIDLGPKREIIRINKKYCRN